MGLQLWKNLWMTSFLKKHRKTWSRYPHPPIRLERLLMMIVKKTINDVFMYTHAHTQIQIVRKREREIERDKTKQSKEVLVSTKDAPVLLPRELLD